MPMTSLKLPGQVEYQKVRLGTAERVLIDGIMIGFIRFDSKKNYWIGRTVGSDTEPATLHQSTTHSQIIIWLWSQHDTGTSKEAIAA